MRVARIAQNATRLASMPECGCAYAYGEPNNSRACSAANASTVSTFWQAA